MRIRRSFDSRVTVPPAMKNAPRTVLFLSFFFSFSCVLSAQELRFANLGDFKLHSGEFIHDCRIGYRTFGQLNADRSNAILMPTWAGGTTEELKSNIGAHGVVNDAD